MDDRGNLVTPEELDRITKTLGMSEAQRYEHLPDALLAEARTALGDNPHVKITGKSSDGLQAFLAKIRAKKRLKEKATR